MKEFRVLHTNMHKGGWGGQPNRILTVSRGLIRLGHYVIVAAPKGATLIKRAHQEGISTFDNLTLPKKFNPVTYVKEVMKLRRVIKENKINVLHTHGSQDTWAAVVAAWLVKPRPLTVRTRHNIFPVRNHLFNRILYRRLIDGILVVSDGVTEVFRQTGVLGKKTEEVVTFHSVVDALERFNPEKVEASGIREELGIPHEAHVVTKVARLAREKGHVHFLDAAELILKRHPHTYFLALGEGPLKSYLEGYAKKLGIQDKVRFTGLRSDVPRVLKVTDVFAFTPVAGESLGTAALEALAMRVPVVAFNIGGVKASVKDGETGFLVNVGDVQALADRLCLLLEDKDLRSRLGEKGRRWMLEAFSEESLVEGNLAFYRRLMEKKRDKRTGSVRGKDPS